MFENYLNVYLTNSMTGAPNSHSICECGYDSIDQYDVGRSHCPKCNAFKPYGNNGLMFGEIPYQIYNDIDINNFNEKDLYRFNIIFVKAKGTYRINFSKQKIYKHKKEYHEAYAIIFDGHDRNEQIKFFNINTREYIKEKDFYSLDIINCSDLPSTNNINGEHIDIHQAKTLRGLVNKLKALAKWCLTPHNEILIKAGIDPECIPKKDINPEGTNPMEILGIKKYTVKQLLKYEQSRSTFNTLKSLEQKLGDKAVPYMDKFVSESKIWLEGNYAEKAISLINEANLSVEKLYRYLYKDAPLQQYLYNPTNTITLLSDSFNMTKDLGMVFDKSPKALVRYHNVLVKEMNLCDNRTKDNQIKEVTRKYHYLQKISETDEDGKYKDKYSIILPTDAKDIILEGKYMRHCVASYVSKVAREDCVILFLRPSAALKTSYVTIEYNVSSNSVVQIKGAHNTRVDHEVLEYIKTWAKERNVTINSYY